VHNTAKSDPLQYSGVACTRVIALRAQLPTAYPATETVRLAGASARSFGAMCSDTCRESSPPFPAAVTSHQYLITVVNAKGVVHIMRYLADTAVASH
jgi:hypothetical protein